MIQNVDVAAETPPCKKKLKFIVAAVLLGIIMIYIVSGAIFWKIGMPAFMFGYKKNDWGGITITDYYGTYLHVHVPDKIDGLEVTEIGALAFSDDFGEKTDFHRSICRNIREVRLPDSIDEIHDYDFFLCKNLKKINLPDGLKWIGERAFFETALSNVTLPDSIEVIGDSAFAYCKDLKEVNLPDGMKRINTGVFYESGLSKITLPDSINVIDDIAFSGCHNLKEINVPDGLMRVSSHAFNETALSDEQKQAFFDKAIYVN